MAARQEWRGIAWVARTGLARQEPSGTALQGWVSLGLAGEAHLGRSYPGMDGQAWKGGYLCGGHLLRMAG